MPKFASSKSLPKDARQLIFFGVSALLTLILAVAGFVAAAKRDSAALSALFVICSVLLLVLTALFVTLALLSLGGGSNFFLYDYKLKRNIRPEELTAQAVNARLDDYITEYFGSPQRLLSGDGLSSASFGLESVLRPAVAYRLLAVAAEQPEVMTAFESCSGATLSVLCAALREAGEADMPAVLERHRAQGGDPEKLARFLGGNRKYIQARLMNYIKRNMERFY